MKLEDYFKNRIWNRGSFLYDHGIIDGKLDYPTVYEKIVDKFGSLFNDRLSITYSEFLDPDDSSFRTVLNSDGPYGAKYFLFHCIVNANINSLDVLLEGKNEAEKQRDFAVLLTLLQQYSDLYLISHYYTNSDFWNFVNNANLLNPVFQCFHFVHYSANIKTSGKPQRIAVSEMTNIYQQGNLGNEEFISRTMNEIIDPLVNKLISILNSGHFDNHFKAYFGLVNDKYNAVPEQEYNMMSDIYNSTKSGDRNLLYQKLKSLGFGEQ